MTAFLLLLLLLLLLPFPLGLNETLNTFNLLQLARKVTSRFDHWMVGKEGLAKTDVCGL